MRCYCKILRIPHKDRFTNGEVCAKIQQAIGPYGDLLTIVKRRKLQWTCLPFITWGQDHLARHNEREKENSAEKKYTFHIEQKFF